MAPELDQLVRPPSLAVLKHNKPETIQNKALKKDSKAERQTEMLKAQQCWLPWSVKQASFAVLRRNKPEIIQRNALTSYKLV